jgi:hypothetical protein
MDISGKTVKLLVPNNIHGSSRTDIDALETGHMHGVACSQALVRQDHIATLQVCGSQGMEAPFGANSRHTQPQVATVKLHVFLHGKDIYKDILR